MGRTILRVAIWQLSQRTDTNYEDDANVTELVQRYVESTGCDDPSEGNYPICAAAHYLNVLFPTETDAACHIVSDTAEQYPSGGTQCRLRTDILWSAINDEWPLLKTRTLIAVFAGIGRDQMHWLTYSRLQFLAAGYSGRKEWLLAGNPELPTLRQCRYWTDVLWRQNLFQMVLSGNRRLYSNKFQNDRELGKHAKKIESKRLFQKEIHRI